MEKEAAAAPVIGRDEEKPRCRRRGRRCGSARPPRGRRKQDYWRQQHGRSRSAPPPRQRRRQQQRLPNRMDWTSEEHQAAREFKRIAGEEILRYVEMTDEQVVEGYRLAGKLHKYSPLSEMQKRIAWVARRYPPPAGYFPSLEEDFFRFIDDTDDLGCEVSRFTVTYHRSGCRAAPLLPCSCKASP